MAFEFMLALFIMAVGLSISGSVTHLYQGVSNQSAYLRFDGRNFLGTIGHLVMSFVCGPFIMIKMGMQPKDNGDASVPSILMGALIAFGWSFINGLLFLGIYFALIG